MKTQTSTRSAATPTVLPVGSVSQPPAAGAVPGELVVGLKGSRSAALTILRACGARVTQDLQAIGMLVVAVPVGKEDQILRKLQATAAFSFVERSGTAQACGA